MNHADALKVLAFLPSDRGRAPSSAERDDAAAHLARCADCVEVLQVVHALATGGPSADLEAVLDSFGCEAVRDELWLLEGLTAEQARAEFPAVVGHLGWCLACRERLVEILAVALADARGQFGPPLVAASVAEAQRALGAPAWRAVLGAAGERVLELARPAVVRIRHQVAAFVEVPRGLQLVPAAAADWRRDAPTGESAGSRAVTFDLAEFGLSGEVVLGGAGGFARIDMKLSGLGAERAEVDLVQTGGGRSRPLGTKTAAEGQIVSFPGVPAGEYVLEIRQGGRRQRVRLVLRIEGGA